MPRTKPSPDDSVVPGRPVEPRPRVPRAEVGVGGGEVGVVAPDVALRAEHVGHAVSLPHPRHVAEHVDRRGKRHERERAEQRARGALNARRPRFARSTSPRKPQAQRLVQRVESASPSASPAAAIDAGQKPRLARAPAGSGAPRAAGTAPRRCWSWRCGSAPGTRRRTSRSAVARSAARSVASTRRASRKNTGASRMPASAGASRQAQGS